VPAPVPTTATNNSDTAASMDAVRSALRQAAGSSYQPDTSVAFTDGTQINVPRSMTLKTAASTLAAAAEAQEEDKAFVRVFKARPWDGAFATLNVMREYLGVTGRGVTVDTFFGPVKPRMMTVEIDHDRKTEVPWGRFDIPVFDGIADFDSTRDAALGLLFELTVIAPQKHQAAIAGFFNLIENWLTERSIYKGKAIRGTVNPTFLAPYTDSSIVYTDQVTASLETAVWGVIRNRDVLAVDRRKVNTRTLLFGPYGTGKTEAGRRTADMATRHGVTFIQVESGATLPDLEQAVATARLLAPAVLFVEDVDLLVGDTPDGTTGATGDARQSRVLELFDGITSKADGVMILMTSNKPASFSKGMLRAGRIDHMIEVGALDRPATETLIRKVIGTERLADDLDYDAVWHAVHDFEPAFVRAVFDQAGATALIRNADQLRADGFTGQQIAQQAPNYVLTTSDFTAAANLLRPQHELHTAKHDDPAKDPLSEVLKDVSARAVQETLTAGRLVSNDTGLVFETSR
jgi:transitional endoplasmic reticulum ATPase